MHDHAPQPVAGERDAVSRWECHCQRPPVLLATFDAAGRVNIKVRDRYWHVEGRVWTHCPRCGAEHYLDLACGRPGVDPSMAPLHG